MKHLKMLGLFAMAAAAMMAFAGSAAAAPQLTSPAGTDYTGELDASVETTVFLEAGPFNVTCTEGTVKGTVTTNNTTHAAGAISSLSFSKCTAEVVKTLNNGSLTAKDDEVFAIENEVTVREFGISCIYGGATGAGTKVGTITDSSKTGTNATIDINASLVKKPGSSFLCVNGASWIGNYWVTSPSTLYVT